MFDEVNVKSGIFVAYFYGPLVRSVELFGAPQSLSKRGRDVYR